MKTRAMEVICAALFVMLFLCPVIPANADFKLDTTFQPVLSSPATVTGVATLSNGKAIVVGSFTSVDGVARQKVSRINADGTLDPSFHPSTEIQYDQVMSVAVQSDGKVLLGGHLSHYGSGGVQNYLFRLNSDGSRDATFDAGGYHNDTGAYGLNGPVRSITIDGNGKILAGGDFTVPTGGIARLNGDGSADSSFNPGSGADGPVTHIARQSDGHIIIGGSFSNVNGAATAKIARLSASGALDATAFGSGIYGGSLLALAVQSDDRILVGGDFTMLNGAEVPKLVRLLANGGVDSTFTQITQTTTGPTLAANLFQAITSLVALPDRIVVGGWYSFIIFNGWPTDHNARIFVLQKSDGGFLNSATFKGKPTDVFALAQRSDGSALAGGSFTQLDDGSDAYYYGLCRLSGSNLSLDGAFKPMLGGQSYVRSLARQADGKLVASGSFYLAGGKPMNGVVRLNPNGSVDTTLASPPVQGGTVNGVLARGDGKLVIGGNFYRLDGQDYRDIALLASTGAVEASVYVGGVNALAWAPGGRILAAMPHSPGVRRLNADLSADTTFNPGSGISNSVQPDGELDRINAVAAQSDGKVLVGGSFGNFSGFARQNIVRLNADGSLDGTFSSPVFTVFNFRSEIFAIALQSDGKILVGGRFSTVNGVPRSTLVRLNGNGTVDETFTSPINDSGGGVYTIQQLDDGRVLAGGNFQVLEGADIYNNLALLNPDGSRDTSFGGSVTGNIYASLTGDAQFLIGGAFSAVNATARYGLARFRTAGSGTITINGGAGYTKLTKVELQLGYSTGADRMKFFYNNKSWTAPEAFAATKKISLPGGDGLKSVMVCYSDDGGTTWSEPFSASIVLDTKPPVGGIVIEQGAARTHSPNLGLTLFATDANGVSRMRFSADGVQWGADMAFQEAYTYSLPEPAANGVKKIHVQFRDAAGLWSATYNDSITLDSGWTPPEATGSLTLTSGKAGDSPGYTTAASVLVGMVPPAGANYLSFSTDGVKWSSWQPVAAQKKLGLPSGDGQKTVYARFAATKTAPQIIAVHSGGITLDTKAPVGSIAINNGAYSTTDRNVTLNLAATDQNGVAMMLVTWSKEVTPQWEPYAPTRNVTLPAGAGTKKVTVKYRDAAGKVSATFSDTILLK